MNQITIHTFDQAVSLYFEPIAQEHGWLLTRLKEDLYEIATPYFVMRIHFGVGHGKSILATLKPTGQKFGSVRGDLDELGVAVLAGYNGVDMQTNQVSTVEDFLQQAQYVANMTKTFGVPYLLGSKSDWDKVEEYINDKIEKSAKVIEGYKFPPSVQKRWHLPKD